MTLEILTSRIWRFERGDGTLISSKIQLLPNGQISGYSHPNESCWGVKGGNIVFYHESGKIATKFDTLNRENGKLILRGNFVDPEGKDREVIHILKEVGRESYSENSCEWVDRTDRSGSLKLGIELGYD
jgi:hypothetical protein